MVALIVALLEHKEEHVSIRECLERAGHEVCIVDCFKRAKAVLCEHSFDLIISDVHLDKGGNVFDFLRWVKNDERLQQIPFVLLSVNPTPMAKTLQEGVRTAAHYLGAAAYIAMEVFDPALLNRELERFLPFEAVHIPWPILEGDPGTLEGDLRTQREM